MNMRMSMLSVAAVSAMAFAAPAQAITVELDFTANFSGIPAPPETTVTGQFIYEAPTLTSDITSLTSIDLTISGHTYALGELGFKADPQGGEVIGTTNPVLGSAHLGLDTFFLSYNVQTATPLAFGYGTSMPSGIGVDANSFSHFSISTVTPAPEPATWALLVTGFLGVGALSFRKRLRRATS